MKGVDMALKRRHARSTMEGGREGQSELPLSSSQASGLARIVRSLVRLQREVAHAIGHRGLIAESLALLSLADNMVDAFERRHAAVREETHEDDGEEELDDDLPL